MTSVVLSQAIVPSDSGDDVGMTKVSTPSFSIFGPRPSICAIASCECMGRAVEEEARPRDRVQARLSADAEGPIEATVSMTDLAFILAITALVMAFVALLTSFDRVPARPAQ